MIIIVRVIIGRCLQAWEGFGKASVLEESFFIIIIIIIIIEDHVKS
jgi:hypothetical protein